MNIAAPTANIRSDDARLCVRAPQVVYTNVEEEDSPTRERGFQTVFATQPDLEWDMVVREIAPALLYAFSGIGVPRVGYAAADLPREFVYYSAGTEWQVVACITPLLGNPVEVDRFGRSRVLFAHALVVRKEDFRRLFDCDPFRLIETYPFFTSYGDVLQRGGVEGGNPQIPPAILESRPSEESEESASFRRFRADPSRFRQLLLMASHQATPRTQRRTLQFEGPPAEMLGFLRDLFRWLPVSHRGVCTFDTLFVGQFASSKQSVSPQWANGVDVGQRITQPDVVRIDLESGRLLTQSDDLTPETPYDIWLDQAFRPASSARCALTPVALNAVCVMQELCWGRAIDEAEVARIPDEVFREFFSLNRGYVGRLLRKNFEAFPGPAAAERLVEPALRWVEQNGAPALRRIVHRFPRRMIAQWLLPNAGSKTQPDPGLLDLLEKCLPTTRESDSGDA